MMRRFLRETWELFYWSLYCPSQLQKRMNDWAPSKDGKDARYRDILLHRYDQRFFSQLWPVTRILSLPSLPGFSGSKIPIFTGSFLEGC